jgi:hypothetical protein
MINSLPDETGGMLVELLKRMMNNEGHSENRRFAGGMRIQSPRRKPGIADGMYNIPDSIDDCNDEIARMFGAPE